MNHVNGTRGLPRMCVALVGGALILCTLATPAVAQKSPRRSRSSEASRVSRGPSLPPPLAHEGWRLTSQFAVVFPTSDMGDNQDALAASTGFSPRANIGYEFMFGNLGITPGLAFQYARFGMEYQDGSVAYIGVQPNVQAALHVGRFVPYASVGVGFDHFRLGGLVSALVAAEGWNTSASGVGLDLQFGANVIITPSMSAGVAWQIHPGFTEFKLVDYAPTGAGMAFMSIVFSVSYLM